MVITAKILVVYKVELVEYNMKFKTWSLKNNKIYKTILLQLWSELEIKFNKLHNMTIFNNFKYYLDYCLSENTNLILDIFKIKDYFNYLSN